MMWPFCPTSATLTQVTLHPSQVTACVEGTPLAWAAGLLVAHPASKAAAPRQSPKNMVFTKNIKASFRGLMSFSPWLPDHSIQHSRHRYKRGLKPEKFNAVELFAMKPEWIRGDWSLDL